MIVGDGPDRERLEGLAARLAVTVASIVGFQLVVGITNLALGAPVWMQVVHILVTDALWIALVMLTATQLAEQPVEVPA